MAYIFVTCLNHAAGLFFKKKNCFVWFPKKMSLFTKIHYFVVVECQVHKIRGLFFKAILRQDIGWYDTHQTGDFAAKMAEWANLALLLFLKNFYMLSTCSESFFFWNCRDLNKLQEGIGEKIGMFIFFVTIFTASLVNAFYHGWELTLVILAAMPVLMIATAIIAGKILIIRVKLGWNSGNSFITCRSPNWTYGKWNDCIWKGRIYRRGSFKFHSNCCGFWRPRKRSRKIWKKVN